VRTGLLLVIVGFCCYGLVAEWPQVHPTLSRLRWYSIAGSLATSIAGSACMMLAWRTLLTDLGSKLPVKVAARVTFVAQLGKYVPGAVWSFAAHVELGHDFQVPRRRGAASVVVALAVAIAVGLLIAALALPLSSPAVVRKYFVVLAIAPLIVVCLAPPILARILNRALRLLRQEPLEHAPSWHALGQAFGWSALGWLFFGAQVWLLLADVAGDGAHSILLAVGGYAFAFSVALLLVVFPNGVGAREVLLAAVLAALLAPGPAFAVAVVVRVVTTVSDLVLGGLGLALGRTAAVTALDHSAIEAEPHVGAIRRRPGRHRKQAQLPAPPDAADAGEAGSASASSVPEAAA
jgi:glycosyltransferase 2 family protein